MERSSSSTRECTSALVDGELHLSDIGSLCSGISSAYGGPLSALDIQYSLTPASEDAGSGAKASKLVEKEIITALYEDSKQVLVRKERSIDLPVWP